MKILETETTQIFRNDYTTRKIVVEQDAYSDIDFIEPIKQTYLALYKKEKLVGFISEINKHNIIVPSLLKLRLVSSKSQFGVFNVKDGKMVYKGNDEPHFNDNGFIFKKVIPVEFQYNHDGKLVYAKNNKNQTVAKNVESLFLELTNKD